MSTTAPTLSTKRIALGDRAFRVLALACGLSVLVILVLIAVSTTNEALPAFREEGLRFVTSKQWIPNEGKFGALAFIYGTLLTSAIALVLAVPVSVGIALFLSEVAPRPVRKPVAGLIDVLAAVPSVVYGLWGVLVLAPALVGFYDRLSDLFSGIPVLSTFFSGGSGGKSFFTAGLILGLMVTPIITSLLREIFDTVPSSQKEAALALGATRWEMIRGAILSYGRASVVGAIMLGLGRAMGETIAAALVIGSSPQITAKLFASGDSMPAVIANQFGEASGTFRAALIGLGALLFGITILVNMAARCLVTRSVVPSE